MTEHDIQEDTPNLPFNQEVEDVVYYCGNPDCELRSVAKMDFAAYTCPAPAYPGKDDNDAGQKIDNI